MRMNRYLLFETYRLGILIGHLEPQELVRRIDVYIDRTPLEEIPHILYVLSLASERRRMLELLTDITRGVADELPACIIAGSLYRHRSRYTTAELFEKAGMLVSLVKVPHDDLIVELKEVKERYDEKQNAYGFRFRRKKMLERILARSEKELFSVLGKCEKEAAVFEKLDWKVFTA